MSHQPIALAILLMLTPALTSCRAPSLQQVDFQQQRDLHLAETIERYKEVKASGSGKWDNDPWVKEPEYYQALDTPELAKECFQRATFGITTSVHNDPRTGYYRLKILHNGFAELFEREDMWRGMLAAYHDMAQKIVPGASMKTQVEVSWDVDGLWLLYDMPPLNEQVKGREKEFLRANIHLIKQFLVVIEHHKKEGRNQGIGFYGEPASALRVALELAEIARPDSLAQYKLARRELKLNRSKTQHLGNIARRLELAIEFLDDR